MKSARLILVVCAASILFGSTAWGLMPIKPGPEQEILKNLPGTWDMIAKVGGAETKGTAIYKLELGGHCVSSEIKTEFLGQKYEQKGMGTYDATKKKFVFAWADSLSTTLNIFEGTYDEASRKLTATGELTVPGGSPAKFKMVVEVKSVDNHVQTLAMVGADGKEQEMVRISYTRKK